MSSESSHTTALVPIENSAFAAPELLLRGRQLDIGLLAEALIYYDRVYFTLSNEPQFAGLVEWFVDRGLFGDLLALLSDGTLGVFHYAFFSGTIFNQCTGLHSLANMQDEEQRARPTFDRALRHKSFLSVLPDAARRAALEKALAGRVLEVKADAFGPAVEATRSDFGDKTRHEIALQALVDTWFPLAGIKGVPTVEATLTQHDDYVRAHWNVDLAALQRLPRLGWHNGTLQSAMLVANKHTLAAALYGWDLFAATPSAQLVGNAIAAADARQTRVSGVLQELVSEVDFPDVRFLVNGGKISLREVLRLRAKGGQFRTWLQDEGERDRNALIRYHNEVARESGTRSTFRRMLRLFGYGVGPAAEYFVPGGKGLLAGVAGTALADALVRRLESNWRPVVFGNWAADYVRRQAAARGLSTESPLSIAPPRDTEK